MCRRVLFVVFVFVLLFAATPAYAASRFWVGGTGTWDNSDTTHWSATSGGAGGASVPGSSDTVTFNASSGGGTVTPNYDMTVTSITMGAFTGTLDFSANNNSPTMTTFSNGGTGTRTLNMGNGTWTITGNNTTVFTQAPATNLTFNANSSTINFSYSGSTGTRSVAGGTQSYNIIKVSAGSDTFSISNSTAVPKDLDFTGFTGTWSAGTIALTGNLTLGTGMTATAGSNSITFNGSGNQVLTSNGVVLERPVTINSTGTTTLADDFSMNASPSALRLLTVTAGVFDANNKNVTIGGLSSNNSNTRSILMGSGTWTLAGDTSLPWNIATPTGLRFDAGASTIKITGTGSTDAVFQGGSLTYNRLWISRGSNTATTSIQGSNTFSTLKDDGTAAHGIRFTSGTTQTITNWEISGSAGNLISLMPQGGSTATFALIKAGGGTVTADYLDIAHSVATPANTWYPGVHSVNRQALGTVGSGWNFTLPLVSDVSVATTSNQATITWTTDAAASSRIIFGPSTRYGTSTPLTDDSLLVTSHTASLSQLLRCKLYHYKIESIDVLGNPSAATDRTFTTAGCPGSARVKAQAGQDIDIASGGTLSQGNLTLTVPVSFSTATDTVAFQANVLDSTAYFQTIAPPSGQSSVGSDIFALSALVDATTSISSFDQALTVTLAYDSADVAGLDLSSLTIYRYDDPDWTALTNCVIDTGARTVTCETTHFSDFSLFGIANASAASSGGNGMPFAGSAADLPGYIKPRLQIVYPDGRIVYLDERIAAVLNKPAYTFTRDLELGVVDANVRTLQQWLNANGFTVAQTGPGSKGQETTKFGALTRAAVIKLQKAKGVMPAAGYFGPKTRAAIKK